MTDYRDDPRPDSCFLTIDDIGKVIAGLVRLAVSFVPWRRRRP